MTPNKMHAIKNIIQTTPIEKSALKLTTHLACHPKRAYYKHPYNDQTYWSYARNISNKLEKAHNMIQKGTFIFEPYHRILRKVKANKTREIYIATWRDRFIEKWLSDALGILLHPYFSEHSYAYRIEGVGLDSCMHRVSNAMKGNNYFIKRDIRNFFYSIPHDKLLQKLETLIDKNDTLWQLLTDRIKFNYINTKNGEKQTNELGLPFGSPLACILSNIYLTDLDNKMSNLDIGYYRYADDFLMCCANPQDLSEAAMQFDEECEKLELAFKPSHKKEISFVKHDDYTNSRTIHHLGLEFSKDKVKLSIEKQRKILNLFYRDLKRNKYKIRKLPTENAIEYCIQIVKDTILERVRSAAIIDYYLKHTTDEVQLRNMDRLLIEKVISTALNKKFKKKDFSKISIKKLREKGLPSLLHRARLHKHGHLNVNFLSLYNDAHARRHEEMQIRKSERIKQMRLINKLKRSGKTIEA